MSTTLTISQTQYPITKIGDHGFIKLPIKEFTKLPPAPIQRNSELRVGRMQQIFGRAYSAGQGSTLSEVAIGVVTKDFNDVDPDTNAVINNYKAGTVMIVDGNTRKYFWSGNPDLAETHKEDLTAKIHYISNMRDMEFAYYPYNSKNSVEKTTEILQGLARRYNWQPKQTMFANGGYKTAIDWASTGPGEDTPSVFESFHTCFEELKVLDSIPKSGTGPSASKPVLKCLKSQPIFAAYLIALRVYPNNLKLFDFIEGLSNITENDLKEADYLGTVTPIEIVALEWTGRSRNRGTTVERPWLDGLAGTTKFASKEPQLDFLLHWIFEYIQNPNKVVDFKKGVRPSAWEGTWRDLYI